MFSLPQCLMSTYLATEDGTISSIKLFGDDSLLLEKWQLTKATSTQNNVIILHTCALESKNEYTQTLRSCTDREYMYLD